MAGTNNSSADFYVATDGNDAWSGSLDRPNADATDGPFATLARARDAVRDRRERQDDRDIKVLIRGGRYALQSTVVFGLLDSAPPGHTTSYEAYPGEKPVFSAGVKIDGWEMLGNEIPRGLAELAQSKVFVADVPADLGRFRVLYDGDRRLTRARSDGFIPTQRYVRTPTTGGTNYNLEDYDGLLDSLRFFGFPKGMLKKWDNMDDVELMIRASIPWTMQILPLDDVDEELCLAKTALPSNEPLKAQGGAHYETGEKTAWIENVLEALTGPGEWVLNTKENKLYLWPHGDEPGDEIFAPGLTELIRVEGEIDLDGPSDTPVRGIAFKGLSFTHGDRSVLEETDVSIQHDWQMFDKADALVRLRGADDCVIERCRFFNSGASAIRLDLHCQRNRIDRNEMSHLGGSGVLLIGYGPGTKDVNKFNKIINNEIHHSGEIYWHSHGIIVHQSGENAISHNYIHHMPRKAICLCGVRAHFFDPDDPANLLKTRECAPLIRWHEIEDVERVQDEGREARRIYDAKWPAVLRYLHTKDNLVECNEIYRAGQMFGDGSIINISGAGEGNIIRGNYIHHIFNKNLHGAIRTDDFQTGTLIEENVIYKTNSCGIIIRHENYVINNVVCDVHPGCYMWIGQRRTDGTRIEGNIFLHTGREKKTRHRYRWDGMFYALGARIIDQYNVFEHLGRMERGEIDGNIYYDTGHVYGSEDVIDDLRAIGREANGAFVDPGFADWENGDFRLADGSPALAMGIKSLDVSRAGLKDD